MISLALSIAWVVLLIYGGLLLFVGVLSLLSRLVDPYPPRERRAMWWPTPAERKRNLLVWGAVTAALVVYVALVS